MTPPRLSVNLSDNYLNKIDDHNTLIVFVRHSGGPMTWQLPSIVKSGKRYTFQILKKSLL